MKNKIEVFLDSRGTKIPDNILNDLVRYINNLLIDYVINGVKNTQIIGKCIDDKLIQFYLSGYISVEDLNQFAYTVIIRKDTQSRKYQLTTKH